MCANCLDLELCECTGGSVLAQCSCASGSECQECGHVPQPDLLIEVVEAE